jgi:hypothetical protein
LYGHCLVDFDDEARWSLSWTSFSYFFSSSSVMLLVLFQLLQTVDGVAADVAQGDLGVLGHLLQILDDLFAPLLGQGGQAEADASCRRWRGSGRCWQFMIAFSMTAIMFGRPRGWIVIRSAVREWPGWLPGCMGVGLP